ncbi:MAG TPA: hypothetical protein VEY71_09600 [Chitinophagales bacterium]|nr:hypothetical protein [Chitinophagales bacterium]
MMIVLFILSMQLNPTDTGLVALRAAYYNAAQKNISTNAFAKKVEAAEIKSDALLLAYKSMALMFDARDSYNPYTKMSSFNKGKDLLESAVKKDPASVEVRFLRFCVQSNAPFFLGYSGNIADDKAVIFNNWASLEDADLKQKIKQFMHATDAATATEKQLLQ